MSFSGNVDPGKALTAAKAMLEAQRDTVRHCQNDPQLAPFLPQAQVTLDEMERKFSDAEKIADEHGIKAKPLSLTAEAALELVEAQIQGLENQLDEMGAAAGSDPGVFSLYDILHDYLQMRDQLQEETDEQRLWDGFDHQQATRINISDAWE